VYGPSGQSPTWRPPCGHRPARPCPRCSEDALPQRFRALPPVLQGAGTRRRGPRPPGTPRGSAASCSNPCVRAAGRPRPLAAPVERFTLTLRSPSPTNSRASRRAGGARAAPGPVGRRPRGPRPGDHAGRRGLRQSAAPWVHSAVRMQEGSPREQEALRQGVGRTRCRLGPVVWAVAGGRFVVRSTGRTGGTSGGARGHVRPKADPGARDRVACRGQPPPARLPPGREWATGGTGLDSARAPRADPGPVLR
jgi:hypothetical protein